MEPTGEQKASFKDALRRRMDASGMTAPAVARALGTSHQKVYQWLGGEGTPRTRELLDALDAVLEADGEIVESLIGPSAIAQLRAEVAQQAQELAELRDMLLRLGKKTGGR